jgi:microtubule-associated protein-like 6
LTPAKTTQLVTVGVKHIKFWVLAGSQLIGRKGQFPAGLKRQTMVSLAFGAPGVTYTGALDGSIFVWRDAVAQQAIAAHAGPVFSLLTLTTGTTVKVGLAKSIFCSCCFFNSFFRTYDSC